MYVEREVSLSCVCALCGWKCIDMCVCVHMYLPCVRYIVNSHPDVRMGVYGCTFIDMCVCVYLSECNLL